MRYLFIFLLSLFCFLPKEIYGKSFFQASLDQPYHLSVGAVLFDEHGRIACHHFAEIGLYRDLYILMRETMENNEPPLMTVSRGLAEEFGATGIPIAFLGSLSDCVFGTQFFFEKTTLYILCQKTHWNSHERDLNDPEASSTILWLKPEELIAHMEAQGKKYHSYDLNEAEIVRRAIPLIEKRLFNDTL